MEHEFSTQDNKVFQETALAMKIVAPFFMLLGVLFCITIIGILGGVILLYQGIKLWGAAASMSSIVDTEGDDVEHFMIAMDKLKSYFTVLGIGSIFILIGSVLAVAALLSL
jgi:hypothetical protein